MALAIDTILAADRSAPPKQRHTAKRIFERLRAEYDYAGGYTVVKDYVRLKRARMEEAFVPLAHPPGHAQVDFGQCLRVISGVRTVLHVFCFDLPHSDAPFVPGKGNDKGKVEGLVKYTQRTFMTPLPHAASFAALNVALAERCRARQSERAGRQEETIGERLVRDLAALRGIPQGLFEACEKKPAKVSSTGLVRYRMNDYSVPTRFAFQNVIVKGFVDEVVIVAGAEIIARHERIYGPRCPTSARPLSHRCRDRKQKQENRREGRASALDSKNLQTV